MPLSLYVSPYEVANHIHDTFLIADVLCTDELRVMRHNSSSSGSEVPLFSPFIAVIHHHIAQQPHHQSININQDICSQNDQLHTFRRGEGYFVRAILLCVVVYILCQNGFSWSHGMMMYFLCSCPNFSSSDDGVVTPTNRTDSTPSNDHLRWIAAPLVLFALLIVILVLCGIWWRWLYKTGETRYWSRVQNEHLVATGMATSSQESRGSSDETDDYSDKKELFSCNL